MLMGLVERARKEKVKERRQGNSKTRTAIKLRKLNQVILFLCLTIINILVNGICSDICFNPLSMAYSYRPLATDMTCFSFGFLSA